MMNWQNWPNPLFVVLSISVGLIVIEMSIVWGLFLNARSLPNWAENVLVAIATAVALKLGDSLSSVVALVSGKELARSMPVPATPSNAVAAASQVAEAASDEARSIAERTGA